MSSAVAFKHMFDRMSCAFADCPMVFTRAKTASDNDLESDSMKKEEGDDEEGEEGEEDDSDPYEDETYDEDDDYYDEDADCDLPPVHKPSLSDVGGIWILAINSDKRVIIKVTLPATNFDYYRCERDEIVAGIDIVALHKMMKIIGDNDALTIYINEDDPNSLRILGEDMEDLRRRSSNLRLCLVNTDVPSVDLCSTVFGKVITIPSSELQRICKNMIANSDLVCITSDDNQVQFFGKGEYGDISIIHRDVSNVSGNDKKSKNKEKEKDGAVKQPQGCFELKSLLVFSKCGKLSEVINIYLMKDHPLVFAIPVSNYGNMYVFFNPMSMDIASKLY